ncbi:MAG TPA: cytidylate kinase-like family protein [Candidatus Limnocylindria bacterium]|jgi:CMP/dCMP kinase|nr:cytidylate kinase-like family protein [Candidatus Limnocylindria bacterium]
MPVITISRQFGAAGVPVGRALAEHFRAEFLDRAIVAQVALRSGIPEDELESYDERLPSVWQRIASALATSSPEVAMPSLPHDHLPALSTHDRLVTITRSVIEDAYLRGNAVILGRGAVFVLGRRRNCFHVQLHASLEERVRYLLKRVDEIPPEARPDERSLKELCRSIDHERGEYIRRLYGANWLDATHYDLAVDSGRLGIDRTVQLIARMVDEQMAEEGGDAAD